MKRVLTFLAVMLLPLSLMAMMPISDANMSKVTGQAGVSINFDFTVDLNFDKLGWGDSDGFDLTGSDTFAGFGTYSAEPALASLATYAALTTLDSGGWIGLADLSISKAHVWPRSDYTMEASAAAAADGGWADLQFLTIDVVTVSNALLTAQGIDIADASQTPFGANQAAVGGVTMVRIGVPTLTITMDSMAGDVVLGTNTTDTIGGVVGGSYYNGPAGAVVDNSGYKVIQKPSFNQLMGKFYVGGLNMATGTNGAVLISAHGGSSVTSAGETVYGSGVTINLSNVKIDYMIVNQAAWGDIEGATDYSAIDSAYYTAGLQEEGWVGLLDLAIEKVVVNGKMAIDVGTVTAGADTANGVTWMDLLPYMNDIYTALGKGDKSFVNIAFVENFNVTMDQMGAMVALGSTHDLDATQVLGNIFVSGMDMTIYNNQISGNHSFIQIFAH